MDPFQTTAAIGSGVIVGFTLGLVGGAGSILAVPLLLYVRWQPALIFAACGLVGAFAGSSIGKVVDGHRLLILFALLMLVIAVMMLRGRKVTGDGLVVERRSNPWRLGVIGLATGTLSGFYGIGGGFLVVPGLILGTGMPTIAAIGSSLVAVGAFGMTTALNYAVSGMVQWPTALLFIAGGIGGGWAGARLAKRLSAQRQTLTRLLGCMLVIVAVYMLYRSWT